MTEKTLADLIGGRRGGGFLGLPEAGWRNAGAARIAVLGAATATPYASAGAYCAAAPATLRAASWVAAGTVGNMDFDLGGALLPEGLTAVDCGDIPVDPAASGPAAAANRAAIAEAVARLAGKGTVPLVLGGDDSVPIPVAEGLVAGEGPLSILQVDAHIDWRESVGGEAMGLSSTMRRISEMPHVGVMLQVGQRGAGSATANDVAAALSRGVHFAPARGLDGQAISQAVQVLPAGGRVLICFDADAFDPSIMPAVIGRLPGGLGFWQALDLIEACAARCRIAGFCFTEFMPSADIGGLGALTATRLLTNVIGRIARQADPSAHS